MERRIYFVEPGRLIEIEGGHMFFEGRIFILRSGGTISCLGEYLGKHCMLRETKNHAAICVACDDNCD